MTAKTDESSVAGGMRMSRQALR